jgi:hypothetical protein
MKYSPEEIARYLWVALIAVVLIAALTVILLPGTKTRSECTGLQYFIFLDQKLTPDGYTVELLNGQRDVTIKSASFDGIDLKINEINVNAGNSFVISSSVSTNKKTEDMFRSRLAISYDTSAIPGKQDSGTCTGRVQ